MGLTMGDNALYMLHPTADQAVVAQDKEDLEFIAKYSEKIFKMR